MQLRHHLWCSLVEGAVENPPILGTYHKEDAKQDYVIYFSSAKAVCSFNLKTNEKKNLFPISNAICMTSGYGYVAAYQLGYKFVIYNTLTEEIKESDCFFTNGLYRCQLNSIRIHNFGTASEKKLVLISSHNNGHLRLYKFPEMQFIQNLNDELSFRPLVSINYNNFCLSPSGLNMCAVIDNSKNVLFWKYNQKTQLFENGSPISLFSSNLNLAMACDWSPDSSLVAISDMECVICDFKSATVKQRYPQEESLIRVVKFSPNDRIPLLAYGEENGLVFCVNYKLWNKRIKIKVADCISGLDFSPNGQRFFVGTPTKIRTYTCEGCFVRPLQQLCIDAVCMLKHPCNLNYKKYRQLSQLLPEDIMEELEKRDVELSKSIEKRLTDYELVGANHIGVTMHGGDREIKHKASLLPQVLHNFWNFFKNQNDGDQGDSDYDQVV